jgi:glycosyltransferase involved in cell wall biosynthesis
VAWGPSLFQILDEADIFVLCSLTEGLPKALLEAMARGLPAIGSNVGGIPELLPPEALVPTADPQALARKITELALDPGRLTASSALNFAEALKYREEVLSGKRIGFYQDFKAAAEQHARHAR